MTARIAQVPPNPWDTHIDCMVECLACGIEWGWGASDDKLRRFVAEHNAQHHPFVSPEDVKEARIEAAQ